MNPGIAIIESAAAGALGSDRDALASALVTDRTGVTPPEALEQAPAVVAGTGEVRSTRLGRGGDRAEQLLGMVLSELRNRAGPRWPGDAGRTMLVLGTTLAGMRHGGQALRRGDWTSQGSASLRDLVRTPAGAVAQRAMRRASPGAFGGGVVSLSCACASALSAIAHGCSLLRAGAADAVVAGGYDPISEFAYGGFNALQLVATGPLSPFAEDREGMKLGEGCALLLLRRIEDVGANEKVLGIIDAIGESSDAHHLTQPHPEGAGAAAALKEVLRHGQPGLLLAHATGTPGNDDAEYRAYMAAFQDDLPKVPVTALKSRLGHPLGAAGALELVATLRCLEEALIPAGGGRAPAMHAYPGLDLVHDGARRGSPASVCALAAGFGGANVAVRVQRPSSVGPSVRRSQSHHSITPTILGSGVVCSAGRGVESLAMRAEDGDPSSAVRHAMDLLDAARTRRLSDLAKLMLAAVEQLRRSLGVDRDWLRGTPLIAATWHGAVDFTDRYYSDLVRSGIDHANPMLFAESVPNIGSAHVSMANGITAASSTVVGTRTAALEALALVRARFMAGTWCRALVVAADECNRHVDRVLSASARSAIQSEACAVAVLLGEGGKTRVGAAAAEPAAPGLGGATVVRRDCGAAGPMVDVVRAAATGGGVVLASDPWCGPWRVRIESA
jgi:3-oxoacyl-[acyl-carrier-protein] synthase II